MRSLAGAIAIPMKRRLEVIHGLDDTIENRRDYVLLVLFSCVIATFGLVLNSGAVIIGAMLIAPLMTPILALSLSMVRGDLSRLWRSLLTLLGGAALAVVLSALLGELVSVGGLNFLVELPAEVTTRTQPTLFDLVIALAGGAAASYALAQPELSATLPGVAIATALMPPLCVVGIGFSQGRGDISMGALWLFLANLVAIIFAGAVVFTLVGFGPISKMRRGHPFSRAIILSSTLMLIVAVPLGGFLLNVAQDANQNLLIRSTLNKALTTLHGSSMVSFDKQWMSDHLQLQVTLRSPAELTRFEAFSMQQQLAAAVKVPVSLELVVVPVTVLDPLAPPTETPAPPTETPGESAGPTAK